MIDFSSPQDAWLAELTTSGVNNDRQWDPGFDGERKVVLAKFGFYSKLFAPSPNFIPRFFHKIYPLPIAEWLLTVQTQLYGGLCTITAELVIHFQPTFKYIERHSDALPNVNQQIKNNFEDLIKDAITAELYCLKDGNWVEKGLKKTEARIETLINEALLLCHIQSRAIAALNPVFKEIELDGYDSDAKLDARFTQTDIYLNLMKKNFEFRQQQSQAFYQQEQALEQQRLAFKQKQLQYCVEEDELLKQQQQLEIEAARRLLVLDEDLKIEQQALEMRLHLAKIEHEKRMQETVKIAEVGLKKEQLFREQQVELDLRFKQLEHERLIKEKELEVEMKEQERFQLERQKLQEHLEAERIQHKNRLHEMQLAAELRELELRAEASKNKDIYLRREIEWLVLDKQRVEMTRSIREASRLNEDNSD